MAPRELGLAAIVMDTDRATALGQT